MQNDKEEFKKNFINRLIQLSIKTLKFSEKLRKKRNLWSIADQLIRSTTSIGANVIEAKSSSSKREYTRFFQIALKSANESKYWLIVIKQYSREYANPAQKLLEEVEEVSKILASSVLTLKGKKSF